MLSMCALLIPAYGIGAFHADNIVYACARVCRVCCARTYRPRTPPHAGRECIRTEEPMNGHVGK
eukprot:COSAG01_NODE_38385_length_490_cov_0.930946_1_plen_63_part_10